MKNLSIAILAALSLLSFAGCKKKTAGGGGDAVAKMGDFKDQMCKCADKACADKVNDAMTKWSQDYAKEAGDKAAKPSEDDAKKTSAIMEEYTKCQSKLMAAAAPPPPPPAPGSDQPAGTPPAGSDQGSAAAGGAPPPPPAPAGDKPAGGSN